MELRRVSVSREIHPGSGVKGRFLFGDAVQRLEELSATHAGKIKLIYIDPPFQTGKHFSARVRIGDWNSGNPCRSLELSAYSDQMPREAFLALMRRVLTLCHALLRDDGMLFLHIDFRTHPYLRLLGDEIFGEKNFLNEIVWTYQTGGRSTRHFSRKHDVILFYAKSDAYDFDINAVMSAPTVSRSNHMRKHVDPDGRVYRSINSGGRLYTYYDDDPVAPTDVWNDLKRLQQKDPERTGYDTQKPLSLLNRIVKCASRKNEIVLDPFAGSSTTLEAAVINGRSFIGIDNSPVTLNIARRRLKSAAFEIEAESCAEACGLDIELLPGIGFYRVTLESFTSADERGKDLGGFDAIESWSLGYLKDDAFEVHTEAMRTKKSPVLPSELELPIYEGRPAVCVNDVFGKSYCFEIVPDWSL